MEAKDLMIGDWVQVPCLIDNTENYNAWCQIKQLRDCDLDVIGFKELSYDEICPIPLTPEILEKNGFTKSAPPPGIHARCHNLDNKEEKYHLTIANYNKYKRLLLNVDSVDSECFNIRCDYVHELQHALRICGIEKEIVL